MIMTPARTIREAREGLDRLLPLIGDLRQAARIRRVCDELRVIRGDAGNGTMVPVDRVHLEEMQHIVGRVCLDGGIDIRNHSIIADICVAMREIGLQAESVIA